MDENKKSLIKKALLRHPGKMLYFCASEKSWDACFRKYDKQLAFYYNLENGATYTELLDMEE